MDDKYVDRLKLQIQKIAKKRSIDLDHVVSDAGYGTPWNDVKRGLGMGRHIKILRELARRDVDVNTLLGYPATDITAARLEALDSLQMLQKRLLEQMTTADREGSIEGFQELAELFRGVAEYVKQADPDCDADSPGKLASPPDAPQRGRAG